MTLIEKLANIQAELKAPKSQWNEFGKYHYRNCEDILEAVKPLCKKYKTALILTDDIVMIGERYYVKARAMLHDLEAEGETMIDAVAYAREEESKKGMDGSQVTGASSSYARKYALNGLFNIDDTKDSDTTNKGDSTAQSGQRRHAQQGQQQQGGTGQQRQQAIGKMTLEQARKFSMKKGKYANIPFKDVPADYLKWCSENLEGYTQEAARLILNSINETGRQEDDYDPYQDDELPPPPWAE